MTALIILLIKAHQGQHTNDQYNYSVLKCFQVKFLGFN